MSGVKTIKDNMCTCCEVNEKAPGFRYLCWQCWQEHSGVVGVVGNDLCAILVPQDNPDDQFD